MTHRSRAAARRLGLAVLVLAAVGACSSRSSDRRAQVEIRGTDPGTGAPVAVAPAPAIAAPAAGGILTYEGYQTVVAGEGDTVSELADRVGLSASELGAYNGLTPTHRLRAGDELVLPPRPGGYGTGDIAAAPSYPTYPIGTAPGTIEQAPLPSAGDFGTDTGLGADTGSDASDTSGEWSPAIAAAAIERSTGLNPDGTLAAPPSSTEPVPPEPEPRRELQSPGLDQYQTGSTGSALPPARPDTGEQLAIAPPPGDLRLQRPVDGPVAIGFNKGAGPNRNDGVDFAAPAGAPVVAAADGEVALVSQSLGGLGTIVLLRHGDELLTVYGRIDGVGIAKGDKVRRGQQIGVVAAAESGESRMHFEVRRGAESLDPMLFL